MINLSNDHLFDSLSHKIKRWPIDKLIIFVRFVIIVHQIQFINLLIYTILKALIQLVTAIKPSYIIDYVPIY